MKVLLGEMYSALKDYLETLGWEALTVQDLKLRGQKDKDILEYARKNKLLVVMRDQRTAELADLAGVKYVLISNAVIAKIVDAEIRLKYAD